jgi:uncharacterized protein (DUF952 family)
VHIFHITSAEDWARAQRDGVYTAASLPIEGFIHCSDQHQLTGTGAKHFKGRTGLVLLRIDPSRLDAEVRHENLMGGDELFPHVYGTIPLEAVVDVTPFEP